MPEYEVLPHPVRIGLVADTHLSALRPLPQALIDGLEHCDLIFHAGDLVQLWVLEHLSQIAPVYAVYGNNDEAYPDVVRALLFERYFVSGKHRIGLIHGHHLARGTRMTAREYAFDRMRGLVDWVVYGHSHRPMIEERNGVQMVNPGSPTQPRWSPRPTYAILDVRDTVRATLVDI